MVELSHGLADPHDGAAPASNCNRLDDIKVYTDYALAQKYLNS